MIKQFEFPNGFRVIHEKPQTSIPMTSINILCEIGSAHEPDTLRGASHFIEHMCFKGTKKIPQSNKINSTYDNIGAYFNAFTDKQYTCYVLKCQDIFLTHSILVLSDMLMNSTFNKKEFEKEKRVVVEENILNSDNPVDILDENINKLIYNGSVYAYPIDSIHYHKSNTLEYKEILDFYHKYYQPENLVFSIVSNMDFEEVLRILKKSYFMRKKRQERIRKNVINLIILPQLETQYSLQTKKGIQTTYLTIAFRTCSQFSPDKYALMILKNIIGGSMRTSRLFTILREQNGLTYSSRAYLNFYENMGDIQLYAEFNPTNLMKNNKHPGVLPLMIEILNDLVKNGITEKEFEISKNNLKGSMLMQMENIDTQCNYNGEEVLLYENKNIVPYKKYYETYFENVTKKQVMDVIKKYLKRENMSISILSGENLDTNSIQKTCEKMIA